MGCVYESGELVFVWFIRKDLSENLECESSENDLGGAGCLLQADRLIFHL